MTVDTAIPSEMNEPSPMGSLCVELRWLTLLPRLALLLLEEGEVLGVAGLLHLFAGDEAEGCAIDAVA